MSTAERWLRFRELPEDIVERLARLPAVFDQEGVLLAYLFGSLAEGRPAHDVDLALLMPEDRQVFRLRDEITRLLDTQRLDLVDLRRASPLFRFEIIRSGRVLYAADDDQQLDFELATLRLYRDTAYMRRQQEKILRKRLAAWLSVEKPSPGD